MKRSKRKKKFSNEVFVLAEQSKENAELFANNLKDDTLSLKAHGLWAVIWFESQNSNKDLTLEMLCKNKTETPQDMQPALQELIERGHITVDENNIITLK